MVSQHLGAAVVHDVGVGLLGAGAALGVCSLAGVLLPGLLRWRPCSGVDVGLAEAEVRASGCSRLDRTQGQVTPGFLPRVGLGARYTWMTVSPQESRDRNGELDLYLPGSTTPSFGSHGWTSALGPMWDSGPRTASPWEM